jgi:phage baseplate assembly protein W
MTDNTNPQTSTSFLGSGWSFPPRFVKGTDSGEVLMSSDEDDIAASLRILFGTVCGERFLQPKYGLDMQALLFEPFGTTMTTLIKDRVKTAILIYEARIIITSLEIDTSALNEGKVSIIVEYTVRATNSRYNLVYPFYLNEGSEVCASLPVASTPAG